MKRLIATLACLGLFSITGCGEAEEAVNDLRAIEACDDYCDKKFDCADEEVTDEEDDACEQECVDDLEDVCGPENREDAIETLNGCVENSCGDFTACLVFDAAPECFGFVD